MTVRSAVAVVCFVLAGVITAGTLVLAPSRAAVATHTRAVLCRDFTFPEEPEFVDTTVCVSASNATPEMRSDPEAYPATLVPARES